MSQALEQHSHGVPRTQEGILDQDWLSAALTPLTGGEPLKSIHLVNVFQSTVASAVRFKVEWSGGTEHLCIKAYLDLETSSGHGMELIEPCFYRDIAPYLQARVPECVATVIDAEQRQGVIIMRDLVTQGATFCSALEPFSIDDAAASLEQLARLHAGAKLLEHSPWIERRVTDLVEWNIVSPTRLQELLDGERGRHLEVSTRDAARLIRAMKALAAKDAALPATLLHGDCHAGNTYRSPEGPGLLDWQMVQRGGWAIDVAYHISSILPVDLAEAHEEILLAHYLDVARSLGNDVPAPDSAFQQYRAATVYGFYMWAITTRPAPTVSNTFVDRLGKAVQRHDSYRLLNV